MGTGFSFTDSDAGYATNETDVAVNLYRYPLPLYTVKKFSRRNFLPMLGLIFSLQCIGAVFYAFSSVQEV